MSFWTGSAYLLIGSKQKKKSLPVKLNTSGSKQAVSLLILLGGRCFNLNEEEMSFGAF